MDKELQIFNIRGIQCNKCVNNILKDLNKIKKIKYAEINSKLSELKITSEDEILVTELQSFINEKYIISKKLIIDNYLKKKLSKFKQLYPLFLIIIYITLSSLFLNINNLNVKSIMIDFMGIFFIVFSFFKFLDLKGFKDSFHKYDLIGKRSKIYCFIYPLIEITIGLFLLNRFQINLSLYITIIILLSTTTGVIQTLRKNSNAKCACLGTVLNLPMTEATLIENITMIIMSILILNSNT